jgi:hypothetical protein
MDGDFEGQWLRLPVGDSLGENDGRVFGMVEGPTVWKLLGLTDGDFDGDMIGILDRAFEGDVEGL